jgi:hypothetical protein
LNEIETRKTAKEFEELVFCGCFEGGTRLFEMRNNFFEILTDLRMVFD